MGPAKRLRRCYWNLVISKRETVTLKFGSGIVMHSPTKNVSAKNTFIHKAKDPRVFKWMDANLRPGMNVIDVGANVGAYALFIAKRVSQSGRVIAVEPTASNLSFLYRNANENRLDQLIIEAVAVGEAKGRIAIIHSAVNAGEHHVAALGEVSASQEIVDVVRLDDLVAKHGLSTVDFVKIDVEGFEHRVLVGFQETLRRHSPLLLIEHAKPGEIRYGFDTGMTRSLLESLGYFSYSIGKYGLLPYDWSKPRGDALWSKSPLPIHSPKR